MRTQGRYLHPRPFVGNNIEYRIASSQAIARYKEAQTFVLNQIAFNPFHEFSETAKELLLLTYDVCFDFVVELEQYLLVKNEETREVNEILELVDQRVEYYLGKISTHGTVFQKDYIKYWVDIHEILLDYFKNEIIRNSSLEIKNEVLFNKIVDVLIKLMNHSLYELQEIDSALYSRDKILVLDELSCEILSAEGLLFAIERLNILYGDDLPETIIIKDYIELPANICLKKIIRFLNKHKVDYYVI